jgi:hypothetical protein
MGLIKRGKLPDMQLPENAPWYQRAAAGVGGLIGDAPAMAAGAIAGTPGGPIVAGAASFAAPMAIREALTAAYTANHASSWEGLKDIALAGLRGTIKGAVIGGVTMGAGRVIEPLVAPLAGRAVLEGGLSAAKARFAVDTATAGTELAAMTTTAAALDGHLPTAQDFMDNAILFGGLKGAVAVAKGLRNTYAETGKPPAEVVADAKANPEIAKDLAVGDTPAAYAPLALEERIKAAIDADPRPEALRKMLMNDGEPAKLGEPPIKDPVKPEYITDQDTLKGVLRGVEQLYADEITQQTRGEVTNKATAAAALRSLSTDGAVEHAIGTAENATQLYARAHVLKSVLDEAYSNMAKLQGVPEAELTPMMKLAALASNEKVAMVYAEYRGARAEAGRALQIFQKIRRDNSLIDDAETLIKLSERKGSLQDIAALATSLKDPAQFSAFLKGVGEATTTEKVLEAWKSAILTGPQTHLANIAGNVMKWMVELPESTIAATITAGRQLLKGDPLTMAQYKARALAPLYGLQMGAVDALKVAGEVWQQKGAHVEKADIQRGAIPGRAGEIIRLPFKALQVEDVLFRTVAERAESHIMAVDRAVEEGFNPNTIEGQSRIAALTADPTIGLEEEAANAATKRVQDAGAEAVFAQKLGPRMAALQQAMAGHWSQFIIPFFRTPANLVSWALQHTPILNFMSGRWREDFAAGGERQNRAIARVTIGAALTMTAFSMAEQGTLTGGGLFDKEEGNAKRAAGWQPYSIQIGDKYYSYQRIEPLAKVLGIAADVKDMWQKTKDEGDKAKLAAMVVLMFGNATVSTTYLSGLSNAIQSIADPTRYGENFLEQYASSLVPKAIGQAVTAVDPYKREVNGIFDAMQSQVPFLREKLMPKRDVWGEPVANDKWFDVMPVAVTQKDEDKVKTEAVRLHLALTDAPKFLLERGPFKSKERQIELSAEQRDVMREVTGKNAMTILAPIVGSADWKNIPDFAKAAIYMKVFEGTRKQGQYAALPPDDAARAKLREKIVGEVLRQVQEVSPQ